MKRRVFVSSLLAGVMVTPIIARAQPGAGPGTRRWSRERLYGSPLMTLEERQEHQRRMWNAKTVQERNQIRNEHRKQMLERAQKQNYKVDEKQDDFFSVPTLD